MPYENDGILSWELLVERINSDLANTVGNLVKRTVSMTNKYFGGIVTDTGVTEAVDDDFKAVITGTRDKVEEKMNDLHVADGLTEVINLFKRCNKYIDETEPWVLAKDETKTDRLKTVMYNLTEGINIGAALLKAFMPETSEKILAEINAEEVAYDDLNTFGHYKSGNKVTEDPQILFQRLDLDAVMKEVEKRHPKVEKTAEAEEAADAEPLTHKEAIDIDAFGALEFRVGQIIKCEAVEKSKKLLCSQVQIGNEVKQIVSGIRKFYSPEEMVGKTVMVVCKLKPAKLAGVLSEGMLLCAEDKDGNLALMTPEKAMPSGSEIC